MKLKCTAMSAILGTTSTIKAAESGNNVLAIVTLIGNALCTLATACVEVYRIFRDRDRDSEKDKNETEEAKK